MRPVINQFASTAQPVSHRAGLPFCANHCLCVICIGQMSIVFDTDTFYQFRPRLEVYNHEVLKLKHNEYGLPMKDTDQADRFDQHGVHLNGGKHMYDCYIFSHQSPTVIDFDPGRVGFWFATKPDPRSPAGVPLLLTMDISANVDGKSVQMSPVETKEQYVGLRCLPGTELRQITIRVDKSCDKTRITEAAVFFPYSKANPTHMPVTQQ